MIGGIVANSPAVRRVAALLALSFAVTAGTYVGAASANAAGSYQVTVTNAQLCSIGNLAQNGAGGRAYSTSCDSSGVGLGSPDAEGAGGTRAIFQVLSPSSALNFTAATLPANTFSGSFYNGYAGGSYWATGGTDWGNTTASSGTTFTPSHEWGIQLYCGDPSYCKAPGTEPTGSFIGFNDLTLTVAEAAVPAFTEGGLLTQTGWVWNTPGDPWSASLSAADPSGVCSFSLGVGGGTPVSSTYNPTTSSIQQCPTPLSGSTTINTAQFVTGGFGSFELAPSATNAAGNKATGPVTVDVDDVAPTIAITQTNDNASSGDGNSAPAQLQVTPTVGPSGISSISCTVDGQPAALSGPATSGPAPGSYSLSVPDNTTQTVACSVANNAVDPQGAHATAEATFKVKAWDSSAVSFKQIADALVKRTTRVKVRVGGHFVTVRRHGKTVRIRVGGHLVTRTVTRYVERCSVRSVKVRHKGHTRIVKRRTCVKPSTSYEPTALIAHGKSTTIYGQLTDATGTGLGGQTVTLTAEPTAPSSPTITIGTVTTDASGGWSATIPPGPSEVITASYAGSASQLPSSATATETVPARIELFVSSRHVRWTGHLIISGSLLGGYVPPDGVAMRLLFRIPGRRQLYVPVAFRTNAKGEFLINWSWGGGTGRATYGVAVGMTASESDYPFEAAHSRVIPVTFSAG